MKERKNEMNETRSDDCKVFSIKQYLFKSKYFGLRFFHELYFFIFEVLLFSFQHTRLNCNIMWNLDVFNHRNARCVTHDENLGWSDLC